LTRKKKKGIFRMVMMNGWLQDPMCNSRSSGIAAAEQDRELGERESIMCGCSLPLL